MNDSENKQSRSSYTEVPEMDGGRALVSVSGGRRRREKTPVEYNLNDLFPVFLCDRQRASDPRPLRNATVRSYRQAHRAFASTLAEVKHEEDIQEALRRWIDKQVGPLERMQNSGMNVYIRSINSFFSWCCERGFLGLRVKLCELATAQRPRPKIITERDIVLWKKFQAYGLTECRVKYMILLILDTGLRAEECLTIREEDIDWHALRIWVKRKGRNDMREVPMSPDGKRLLRQYLTLTDAHRETLDREKMPYYSYVFCTQIGKKVSYRNSLRDMKAIARPLGMDWTSWHTYRRTFGTEYLRRGGLITDLQEIYDHQDIRTTLVYLGSSAKAIREKHARHSPISSASRVAKSDETFDQALRLAVRLSPGGSRQW